MGISKEEVKHIAKLARIEFSEDEINRFTEQLSTILNYVSKLDELNTEDIVPTSHVIDLKNCFRDDEIKSSLPVEESLRNAPQREKFFFKVPKIIE
ncbi:MAG: asparaginyl/glutamyl-tRNA amidotransferase subunit C [Candidatus Schekmanbacteria bacterium RIFCSPHIGHO2_02_FULL_38_11]|uniref:Aspartyl/glutamyl-tRNA(Asn/Gln) amidotransferase subunit C n=1 Tax=Candidatus Schekmanbacteria bacterium RIFCSPLOWO2_12_FULL_38_15 TaxID=1817883 RepID=A0A1F7SLF7_9BACT|nr:MAG: asparaginyl/glutamyl-tRNA amidotransferase subunit C [Candidatus Schekmanbacteria bacterium GWA2_38_9]OGL51721.1 MAG: asparaginyl/glutamyl-tRNA amidotransferase subunit C [Candidatus Schekmanbacteria bacterium RIFCSPLOWO2_02_FULL_38_14]OGL52388.1 MAG: asparaginyl/glutamyl-tRNA amidotransferase subunit C [Candidatus Schekmanbacteria bacterium RIFCSPHIGHO2_02_FULL_38_11]OGL54044.1 MAG: asparaginyl/glutamyl-tRNA amidotransferase subunit C [Candidatus Schekmanbacteria bacterium RIFCSPLOWO2_1